MKVTVTPIVIKVTGTIRDHPDNCIVKIGQNTEKSPEDLRKLVVTRTSVKDHDSDIPIVIVVLRRLPKGLLKAWKT